MYEQASTLSKEKIPQMPSLADEVINRFMTANDDNQQIIGEIEDKLHAIINKREPTSEGKPEPQMENDLAQKLFKQVGRVEIQRSRLKRILEHLNQIV